MSAHAPSRSPAGLAPEVALPADRRSRIRGNPGLSGFLRRGTKVITVGVVAIAALSEAMPALADEAPAHSADARAEVTLRGDARSANASGPLAAAERLQPGTAAPPSDGLIVQAELRNTWRTKAFGPGVALGANVLLASERTGARWRGASRVNELQASLDLGAWQASAGKKVLGWDVGYGFRPNDVVQQQERRTLFGQTPEGRPLVQLEHFDAESALSLVWVNPERWRDDADQARGARESAFAARAYRRAGAADWHFFARHGRHTGASTGAAVSWVADDATELHASARAFERHDRWNDGGAAAGALLHASPWAMATGGGGVSWLAGGQWTGESRIGVLAEAWHDATAPSDRDWSRWRDRNRALVAMQSAPAAAVAGNLAWQATPLAGSLRRDNLFLRLSWSESPWQLSLDALWQPADRGRVVTAALQWQGDRLRIDAAWRHFGGPAGSLLAQLPVRGTVLLAASLAL